MVFVDILSQRLSVPFYGFRASLVYKAQTVWFGCYEEVAGLDTTFQVA